MACCWTSRRSACGNRPMRSAASMSAGAAGPSTGTPPQPNPIITATINIAEITIQNSASRMPLSVGMGLIADEPQQRQKRQEKRQNNRPDDQRDHDHQQRREQAGQKCETELRL